MERFRSASKESDGLGKDLCEKNRNKFAAE